MLAQPQTFPCPKCSEIINDSMKKCPFCSTEVDPQAAAAAAEIQSKVNQAYSDANYLRIAAGAMWAFLGLSFIPLIPLVGWGFLILFVGILVMVIRWQVKFRGLQTKDPDYPKAKRAKNLALILWVAAIPVGFVIRPLLYAIVFR